jgi:DNA-binding transcriptional regulator of glucitol operon
MLWIIALVIIAIALFFLLNTVRMKRMQSEIRTAYMEDGLTYDEANKVGWYLIDMFIYMRKKKNPKLAKIVMNSTMTVFKQRLYKNEAYEGNFLARMQYEGIRDACLIINRPIIEAADLMYSSVVASYEAAMKANR